MKHLRKWIFVFPIKKKEVSWINNKRYLLLLCTQATFLARKKFIYRKNFFFNIMFKPIAIVYLVYCTVICYIILKKDDDHTVSSSQFLLNVDFNADE